MLVLRTNGLPSDRIRTVGQAAQKKLPAAVTSLSPGPGRGVVSEETISPCMLEAPGIPKKGNVGGILTDREKTGGAKNTENRRMTSKKNN
jgi:hypothetical protein